MAVGDNVCTPLFEPADRVTVHCTANVVGKTFGDVSGDLQSGPLLAATSEGGNIQAATCGAGLRALGVFAYDQVSGAKDSVIMEGIVPVTAGATVTFGQEVQSDATGRAIPLAAGKSLGKAVSGATVGNDCYVKLNL